jgi:hypothetical protein
MNISLAASNFLAKMVGPLCALDPSPLMKALDTNNRNQVSEVDGYEIFFESSTFL